MGIRSSRSRRTKAAAAVQFLNETQVGMNDIVAVLEAQIAEILNVSSDANFYELSKVSGIPESSFEPLKERIAAAVKLLKTGSQYLASLETDFTDDFTAIAEPQPQVNQQPIQGAANAEPTSAQ